ncbi:hypothetical protein HOY80DRAFT_947465 [Tuber brumale]|nr:hypothetical protein HOY80DRAFT_947465 [Tuber brumale]
MIPVLKEKDPGYHFIQNVKNMVSCRTRTSTTPTETSPPRVRVPRPTIPRSTVQYLHSQAIGLDWYTAAKAKRTNHNSTRTPRPKKKDTTTAILEDVHLSIQPLTGLADQPAGMATETVPLLLPRRTQQGKNKKKVKLWNRDMERGTCTSTRVHVVYLVPCRCLDFGKQKIRYSRRVGNTRTRQAMGVGRSRGEFLFSPSRTLSLAVT